MLVIGDRAIDFSLPGVQGGRTGRFALRDYRGRWVVLFFYPADFSFVCPTEVRGFQQRLEAFRASGCEVLGVSVDSVESHLAWARELGGVDYPLLSDEGGVVSRAYGVLDEAEGRARRATFIIGPGGCVEYCVLSHKNVGRSVEETLRVLKALQTGRQCPADWQPGEEASA